ncbi:MarR family winged helix-turn-helix transcriptional regulator [Streptomyces aidingensis]|uniref:DNA-binding transcriptional regulator, MarR family n=1 Tax=Streptomyces aidingensis TaxID=910347 RepID=A0A1I1FGR1_9ACTN|nr:MarR family transcriptional regulator [Streptomyces aidingensis]SFB98565.1 DNA-binding transcriptional regulator, MarR family [Streptomyces aidingensis]
MSSASSGQPEPPARTQPATGAEAVAGYHGTAGRGTGDTERDRLLQKVMMTGRELGLTLLTLNNAAARAIGMHPTDAWIISYLQSVPAEVVLSPGDLARITGLTTGAITGVIDRLERGGYVERRRDSQDRRKVIVSPTEESARIARVFQPMVQGYMELGLKYSREELATIASYLEGSIAVAEDTVGRLRRM